MTLASNLLFDGLLGEPELLRKQVSMPITPKLFSIPDQILQFLMIPFIYLFSKKLPRATVYTRIRFFSFTRVALNIIMNYLTSSLEQSEIFVGLK